MLQRKREKLRNKGKRDPVAIISQVQVAHPEREKESKMGFWLDSNSLRLCA